MFRERFIPEESEMLTGCWKDSQYVKVKDVLQSTWMSTFDKVGIAQKYLHWKLVWPRTGFFYLF